MKFKMYFSFLLFTGVLFVECTFTQVRESENSDSNLVEEDSLKCNLTAQESQLPDRVIILGGDTVFITDKGKNYNIKTVNDSHYYYTNFVSKEAETDIGRITLRIANKSDGLLWSMTLRDNIIIRNDSNSIIVVDIENNCIQYMSMNAGTLRKEICFNFSLSDANDFISSEKGLYIKIVKESDYSFDDVLFLEKGNWKFNYLNIKQNGYFNLVKEEDKIYLVDNKKEVLHTLE